LKKSISEKSRTANKGVIASELPKSGVLQQSGPLAPTLLWHC